MGRRFGVLYNISLLHCHSCSSPSLFIPPRPPSYPSTPSSFLFLLLPSSTAPLPFYFSTLLPSSNSSPRPTLSSTLSSHNLTPPLTNQDLVPSPYQKKKKLTGIGKKFQITTLKKADLLRFQANLNLPSQTEGKAEAEAGAGARKEESEKEEQEEKKEELNLQWYPLLNHLSIPPEMVASFSKMYLVGALLLGASGGYVVSEEWNSILNGNEGDAPDGGVGGYEFMGIEEFLAGVWEGKP